MNNKTRIIRSVNSTPNQYTPLSNKLLQDARLSLDTRGLMAFLLSLPNDWIIYKENVQKQIGYGKKKMDRIWSEAKKYGYIISEKSRNPNGTWSYSYTLTDAPLSTAPLSTGGLSTGGKGGPKQSKQLQNKQLQSKDDNDTPKGVSSSYNKAITANKLAENNKNAMNSSLDEFKLALMDKFNMV